MRLADFDDGGSFLAACSRVRSRASMARLIDVPQVMAGQTDVALRRAVLVREQGVPRVAHGTLSVASGEPVWNLVAGKASTPMGSTGDSSHSQESTENGRPPCAQKCTSRQWREKARGAECPFSNTREMR